MDLGDEKTKSRKPNPSRFYQQKLRGWQPLINTNNLYITFLIIGFTFIAIGACLVYFMLQVFEISQDYTFCQNSAGHKCSEILISGNLTYSFQSCRCTLNITISQTIQNPVYIYYGLTNFFQNHRRYLKSRDDNQLKGLNINSGLTTDCEPFRYLNQTIAYAPCGTIANSIFNDTFRLEYISNGTSQTVPWTKNGIAWASETDIRFGRPSNWINTVKPINWPLTALQRSHSAYSGDLELIVWLRSAALPSFKKLHRIINSSEPPFTNGLPPGQYVLYINYSYPVIQFQGTKTFIISATNFLGGKSIALGLTYLIVGSLYLSLAVIFILINHFMSNRRKNESYEINQSTNNGFTNETFSPVEIVENSSFIDKCSTRLGRSFA